jgi:hypothetical protein
VASFRNAGSRPWTLSALRLSPATSADAVFVSGTPSIGARNLTRSGPTVQPGEAVEVRTSLDSASAPPGTYKVTYQLLAPGFVLSGPVRWNVPVRAAAYPPAPALFADQADLNPAPALVRVTAPRGDLVVRFRNAGTRSWSLSAVRLSPAGVRDAVLAAPGAAPAARNLTRSGTSVLPGDVVEVRTSLAAGSVAAGSYRVAYRLIAPGFLLSEPASWPVTVR